MFSKLKSLIQESPTAPQPKTPLFFADTAPSWEQLQELVNAKQTELHWQPGDLETGPPTPLSLRRTFGQQGEPRITLYRDHAAWCPYCEKVILQLEEKRIPYIIEKINMRCYGDKPPEFMAKVPSGLLPVLEIDGKIITESAIIQQLLEQLYPDNSPLLPPEDAPERARASSLMRLERRLFSDWLQWLCNGWGEAAARAQFEKTMSAVDQELGVTPGPYFLEAFSLVDIIFAPFLERIAASLAYYKGFMVRGQGRWLNLERWFAAMETRPPYLAFCSDFYTHAHDLPPQLGGCVSEPEAAPVAAAIDGLDSASWRLPLTPLTPTSLPEPYSPGESPPIDRLKAATKLVSNHVNVTKFALRGVGARGPRPVAAPLSDPTAIPGTEYEAEVDAALRYVAYTLLTFDDDSSTSSGSTMTIPVAVVQPSEESDGGKWYSAVSIEPSLGYLRDRVGVPRDLPLPSARRLRAHLNWVIDAVHQG